MRNVLILTMARSRSSLVAAIVRAHGWNSPPTQRIRPGYPLGTQENDKLNIELRPNGPLRRYNALLTGEDWHTLKRFDELRWVPPEPWFVKVDPFCAPSFEGSDHVKFLLKRNWDDVVESNAEKNSRFNREEFRIIVERHREELSRLDGYEIDTDLLIQGEEAQIKAATEAAGVTFNPKHVADCMRTV